MSQHKYPRTSWPLHGPFTEEQSDPDPLNRLVMRLAKHGRIETAFVIENTRSGGGFTHIALSEKGKEYDALLDDFHGVLGDIEDCDRDIV
jgi:hypothetical protein